MQSEGGGRGGKKIQQQSWLGKKKEGREGKCWRERRKGREGKGREGKGRGNKVLERELRFKNKRLGGYEERREEKKMTPLTALPL